MFGSKLIWAAGIAAGLLGGTLASNASAQQSTSVMTVIKDGDRYNIRIVDGQIETVEVNGLEVDEDLIHEEDGAIFILDEAGDVLAEFAPPPPPNLPAVPEIENWIADIEGLAIRPDGNAWRWAEASEPPRTMLGISHQELDDQLRWFLDMEPGQARIVTRVVEGLPADLAGVQKFDIVVSIDGKKPVSAPLLTKLLREKDAGDEIEFHVIRKGDKKRFVVELQAYDGKKLIPQFTASSPRVDLFPGEPAVGQRSRVAQEALEQARRQLAETRTRIEIDREPREPRTTRAPRLLIEREAGGEAELRRQIQGYEIRLAESEARMVEMLARMERLMQRLEERER